MENNANEPDVRQEQHDDPEVSHRREFLSSLGKWSAAAIAAILLSESLPANNAAGWVNSRGSWRTARARVAGPTAAAHGPTADVRGSTAGQIGSIAAELG